MAKRNETQFVTAARILAGRRYFLQATRRTDRIWDWKVRDSTAGKDAAAGWSYKGEAGAIAAAEKAARRLAREATRRAA
ncbi:MAG: hypothetical protein FJ087_07980 [Deltaproteobacteria bacterium]|nr:hypothetical protein [Deltaproteobacteria bacterium]